LKSGALALALAAVACTAGARDEPPPAWQQWILDPRKPLTRYSLVHVDGRTVVRAHAERSVSGLLREVGFRHDGRAQLRWRWKAERLVEGSDETRMAGDDCTARLVVSFAGDATRLESAERAKLELASALSGRPAPYATLMYIWSMRHAPETVIVNPRSSRVRMIVVEQGAARRGRWLEYERDVVADFRRAFAEEPGAITTLGLLTDADDTQSAALVYYGDVDLR
jgi:hypothetical protein